MRVCDGLLQLLQLILEYCNSRKPAWLYCLRGLCYMLQMIYVFESWSTVDGRYVQPLTGSCCNATGIRHVETRTVAGETHVTVDVLHMGFSAVTRVTWFLNRGAWVISPDFYKKAPLRGYDSSCKWDYLMIRQTANS